MLAIDVGNTHITCAVIREEEVLLVKRIPTDLCLQAGTFFEHLDLEGHELSGQIVMSSVRKALCELVEKESMRLFSKTPVMVTKETPMGIQNRYGSPETLGMDRLVDACACHHIHTRGKRPGIVVDMGTATTIDYLTEHGEFLGGAIVPGLMSSYRGLMASAPELPEVDLAGVDHAVGTTTVECIRSGAVAGHAALVKGLCSTIAREKGADPLVVVTGGLAGVVDTWLPGDYIRDEHLLLRGLAIIERIYRKKC
mgnify:CR=1 FL=1